MRIGTSSKEQTILSNKFKRLITGEKGIGRFAVRFSGAVPCIWNRLQMDTAKGIRTRLTAEFDWPDFDRNEDLGNIEVPYRLYEIDNTVPTGTTLRITHLRAAVEQLDLNAVRTGAIGILTPRRSLFRKMGSVQDPESHASSA